jgi:hypothetical protein
MASAILSEESMKRGLGLAAAAFAVAVAVGTTIAVAAPADLVSHRAVYHMGLSAAGSGSGMANAAGSWSYEFADSCDGWVTEYRLSMTYAYTEGGEVESATDFLSWESKDGLRYRFRVRQSRDGQITEEVEGDAQLKGHGQGGIARYTRPEAHTIKLPKGTIFPTEHTVRLLDVAREGGHILLRPVFDGMGDEGPFEINALIGRAQTNPEAASANPLLAPPSWPMRLAFFPQAGKDSLPDFEMALKYHANGVATDVVQVFKTFSLKGTLQTIEALPRRKC